MTFVLMLVVFDASVLITRVGGIRKFDPKTRVLTRTYVFVVVLLMFEYNDQCDQYECPDQFDVSC